MKVLSDIYTYSKDKSAVVLSASGISDSIKNKKNVTKNESSWFSKNWYSSTSLKSNSWFNKISLPKYQLPKYSFPKLSFPKLSFPELSFPKCPSLNFSFPKCSFPKFTLPTVWFKILLKKLEETRINCYAYLIELFKIIKEKSCLCLNCSCIQCNSNPKYINYPWYKRAFFNVRDNIYEFIYINKESVNEKDEDNEDENKNFDRKGSKSKIDEERNSTNKNTDDKYNMKHSQSSKYSNDLTTLRSNKKLKKTNTDDLKNGEETVSPTKSTAVFSMFSKSDNDNKSPKINSPVNKSSSLYVDVNEEKYIENSEKDNVCEVHGDESIPGSNETSEEKTKFNIKKTWDKFSKIIS